MKYRSYIMFIPFLALASCGQSGPSKAEMQKLLQQKVDQEFGSYGALATTMGIKKATVTVDSMSCKESTNNSFDCTVITTANGTSNSLDLQVTKLNGKWTLLGN